MMVNKPERFSRVLARDYNITTEMTDVFFKNEFLDAETGKADLKEQLKKYLAGWGWKKTVDEFLQYWFESEHYVDERLVKSIRDLRAQGLKCYLATNQEKYRAEYMRREMEFEKLFDKIFVSCDLGFLKPSAEFWHAIWDRLGNPSKQAVLVWDDKEQAVQGAKDVGFKAERYTDFANYQIVMQRYLEYTL